MKNKRPTHDAYAVLFEAASRGWRLIPIKPNSKETFIKGWPEKATAHPDQITKWISEYPDCNWGVVSGKASGVFVVDADSDDASTMLCTLGHMPHTFTVKTGRGKHYYFLYPSGRKISNSTNKLGPKLDVKGDRGYVLFPPSVHPSGALYTIVENCEPAAAPAWLVEKLVRIPNPKTQSEPNKDLDGSNKKITEGGRNSKLFLMAGSMRNKGWSPNAIEAAVNIQNEQHCDPPLEFNEIQGIVKNILNYDLKNGEVATEIILGRQPLAQTLPIAESILKAREEERIFQTPVSRRLVRIIQTKQDPHPDGSVKRDPEACILAEVDAKYLQLALGRSGQVFKMVKGEPALVDGPPLLAYMILASVNTSPEMTSWRRLKKISCTPILLPNGSIVSEPGYHLESQIWIDTRGISFLDVAIHKPRLTAREARRLIEENIFPFVRLYPFFKETAGQHGFETGAFAVVLSGMMCLDDRHNLSAVPMHCVSAPAQACGKTRLVQGLCAAATGTMPTVVTYDGVEEFAKHIPVLLGKGDSAICVDNIRMTVDSAKLAALLTQEYAFNYRPLGASADVAIENVSVLFATGVNLELSGDMPSRCLLIRIEPEDEQPERRKFPFDQISLARELFPRAVMTIKAVLRAHQLAGFPGEKLLTASSRFSDWDRRVRSAIVWSGLADPLLTQEAIRADDPFRNENLRVLWVLRGKFRASPFLTCNVSDLPPDSLAVLQQATGHKEGEAFNEKKVGKYFARILNGRWFEGIRLVKTRKKPGGRIQWQIEAKPNAISTSIEEEPM